MPTALPRRISHRLPGARGVDVGETVMPVLIGALAGSGTGLLLWAVAMVRFGLKAWL